MNPKCEKAKDRSWSFENAPYFVFGFGLNWDK